MKQQTIERLINNLATDAERSEAIASALDKMRSIAGQLRMIDEAIQKEVDRHNGEMEALESQRRRLQVSCPHYETTFFADAAGGNDSWTQCDLCKAEVRGNAERIFFKND